MGDQLTTSEGNREEQDLARQLHTYLARVLREQRAAPRAGDDGLNGRPLGGGGPADGVPLAGSVAGVVAGLLGTAIDGVIGNAVYDALRHGLLRRLRRDRSTEQTDPENLMNHLARIATLTRCAELGFERPHSKELVVEERRLTDNGLSYRLHDSATRLTATVAIDLGDSPSSLRIDVTLVAARSPHRASGRWPSHVSPWGDWLTGSRDDWCARLPLDLTELTATISGGLAAPGMGALSVADRLDRLPEAIAYRHTSPPKP